MQKIIPFLWFNDNAKEAAKFYTSTFKNSKIESASPMIVNFELEGQKFMALNGGPTFTPTPAVSFFVSCARVEEIDELWKKLSEDGDVMMELQEYPFSKKYGWVNDRFGVSWQLFMGKSAQKITPFLFFCGAQNGKAEEAMKFYTSVFKNSGISKITRYAPGMGEPETSVVHGEFSLNGQMFKAMENSRPQPFTFTEGVSLLVSVETQEEVDYFWEKLSKGGEKSRCGWLKDKYGLSWQIVPTALGKLMGHSDPVKSQRVMQAMLQMAKIDIAGLKKAYEG